MTWITISHEYFIWFLTKKVLPKKKTIKKSCFRKKLKTKTNFKKKKKRSFRPKIRVNSGKSDSKKNL